MTLQEQITDRENQTYRWSVGIDEKFPEVSYAEQDTRYLISDSGGVNVRLVRMVNLEPKWHEKNYAMAKVCEVCGKKSHEDRCYRCKKKTPSSNGVSKPSNGSDPASTESSSH